VTAPTGVRFRFRPDVTIDRRPDGICLYLPTDGRGFVARGLTADLVARLRDTVGDEAFGIEVLDGAADGVDRSTWRRLLKELCSRGAVIRPDPNGAADGGWRPATPAIGVMGDPDFTDLLAREVHGRTAFATVEVATAGVEPDRLLDTAWRQVSLVVTFDLQPAATVTRAWNRAAVAAGRRYLPVRMAGHTAEIGPLAVPGESPCFECYWWRRQAQFGQRRSEAAEVLGALSLAAAPVEGHARVSLALGRIHAMAEVCAAIGLEPWAPASLGAVITVQGHPPASRTRPVLRLHDCPACTGRGRP
jgi:bacteriocin biosynthesis cyclodehydratase domain-containing protein